MTPAQLEAVRDSYFRIHPVREAIAETYYAELFRIAPSVRPHFPQNVQDQGRRLADIVGQIVLNLHDMPALENIVAKLAQKHLEYGLQPAHFAPSGAAFLNALAINMPSEVSQTQADAWMAAFTMVTDLMIEEMDLRYNAA